MLSAQNFAEASGVEESDLISNEKLTNCASCSKFQILITAHWLLCTEQPTPLRHLLNAVEEIVVRHRIGVGEIELTAWRGDDVRQYQPVRGYRV